MPRGYAVSFGVMNHCPRSLLGVEQETACVTRQLRQWPLHDQQMARLNDLDDLPGHVTRHVVDPLGAAVDASADARLDSFPLHLTEYRTSVR